MLSGRPLAKARSRRHGRPRRPRSLCMPPRLLRLRRPLAVLRLGRRPRSPWPPRFSTRTGCSPRSTGRSARSSGWSAPPSRRPCSMHSGASRSRTRTTSCSGLRVWRVAFWRLRQSERGGSGRRSGRRPPPASAVRPRRRWPPPVPPLPPQRRRGRRWPAPRAPRRRRRVGAGRGRGRHRCEVVGGAREGAARRRSGPIGFEQ
mmetsp:Transcript_39718/g.112549  ORF Transcript_39718/g.112549 Transcript_39718/m.112549 type:complete len:203 (-) Transcript_39718:39-647(-)